MSLSISNLSFAYGEKSILKNINIQFYPGEVTIIAGTNGSGKTTLIKNIVAQVPIKPKTIFLDDRDINDFSITKKSQLMSYVPQYSSKDFDFTVHEIVEMGRYAYKKEWNKKKDEKNIINALKKTDTYIFKDRYITTLSGGEMQRVMLARALAGNPKYLILDEPSSNLDISHNLEVMKLIKKITKELNITTIIVLHDLNTILHFADRVALMKNGEIKLIGPSHEILTPDNIKSVYNVSTQILQDNIGNKHIVII